MDFDDLVILLGLVGLGYAAVKTPSIRNATADYLIYRPIREWRTANRVAVVKKYGSEWNAYWELT